MHMRIIHLEASTGWGGQEIRILREAEGFRARGHTVVFGVMRGAKLIERARAAGFTVYELNFRRKAWIGCLYKLLSIFKAERIEVVNTHSSLDSWIGGIAARMSKRSLVRTRHLSTPVKAGWNSRFLYGTLADFVVTTCEQIIDPLFQQSGKPRHLFQSIATGVDPTTIQAPSESVAQFRQSLEINKDTFLVGMACVMRSWKGITDFIKAAQLLKKEPNLKWVIIGGGHQETYRSLVKELDLQQTIFFTDHLENPFPGIGALDAFALLSTANEGVSQAILQAAYLKRPLIATPIGGLPEVCLDGVTGILVPPGNPTKVAEAVLTLKENRDLARSLGQNGHELVKNKFTIDQTLNEMEKVFQQVCSKQPTF